MCLELFESQNYPKFLTIHSSQRCCFVRFGDRVSHIHFMSFLAEAALPFLKSSCLNLPNAGITGMEHMLGLGEDYVCGNRGGGGVF